jgi:hypothetical protein
MSAVYLRCDVCENTEFTSERAVYENDFRRPKGLPSRGCAVGALLFDAAALGWKFSPRGTYQKHVCPGCAESLPEPVK